jgi:peptidoglycan/LPS O-acetylase OafA/YrhL
MYLWHWLALEAIGSTGLRIGLPLPGLVNWALATMLLALATLPLAFLSWHLVETRAIRWASHRSMSRRAVTVTVAALAPPVGP